MPFDLHAALPEKPAQGIMEADEPATVWSISPPRLRWRSRPTAKTLTFSLLRYFTDTVLPAGKAAWRRYEQRPWFWIGLGFIGLASRRRQFSPSFRGGWRLIPPRGITQRMRNYLFDHLQRLSFSYPRQKRPRATRSSASHPDVDSMRRFLQRTSHRRGTHRPDVYDQPDRHPATQRDTGADLHRGRPVHRRRFDLVLRQKSRRPTRSTRNKKPSFRPPCKKT